MGSAEETMPEMSKILAVADAYHAMTSTGPTTAEELLRGAEGMRLVAGHTLGRTLVEVLAGVLRDKDLAYRDGSSTDFMDEYGRGRLNLRLRGHSLADVAASPGSSEAAAG